MIVQVQAIFQVLRSILYVCLSPCSVTIFRLGDSYKPSFATVTGRRDNPNILNRACSVSYFDWNIKIIDHIGCWHYLRDEMFGSQIVTDSSLLLLESSIGYSLYIQKNNPFRSSELITSMTGPHAGSDPVMAKSHWKLDRFHHTDWYISPWFGVRLFNTPFSSILVEDTVQKVQLWSSMALKPQQTEICLPTNKSSWYPPKRSKYLCKSIMVIHGPYPIFYQKKKLHTAWN